MTDKYRDNLKEDIAVFANTVLKKYDRGRAEHGQDLDTLDVISEMQGELADMVAYLSILKTQLYEKNKTFTR
jgi:hypothetical protein